MKTIDNVRWLEGVRFQRHRRRQQALGTIAGIILALALWAIIGLVVAVLLTWP